MFVFNEKRKTNSRSSSLNLQLNNSVEKCLKSSVLKRIFNIKRVVVLVFRVISFNKIKYKSSFLFINHVNNT